LWISLLLSVLLSADRIFQQDYEDGSLDIMTMGPVPFEMVAKEIVNNQSLERLTEAHEVAALAVYLASPAAFMINGQDIAIDGHVETFHIK
jgi:heme exporter protein CcmB